MSFTRLLIVMIEATLLLSLIIATAPLWVPAAIADELLHTFRRGGEVRQAKKTIKPAAPPMLLTWSVTQRRVVERQWTRWDGN